MKTHLTLQRIQTAPRTIAHNATGSLHKIETHRVVCAKNDMRTMADGHTLAGYTSGTDIQDAVDLLDECTDTSSVSDWQLRLAEVAPTIAATVADALLQLQAASEGQAIARVLCATPSTRVYGSRIVHTEAEARQAIHQGFHTLKVKVGSHDPVADAQMLNSIHATAPTATLRADANGSWSLDQASAFCKQVDSNTLQFLEEPFPQSRKHLPDWQYLQEQTAIPLASDSPNDHWWDCVDTTPPWQPGFATIKPRFCGGISAARIRAQQYMQRNIVPVFSHSYEGAHGQILLAHLCASLPRNLDDGIQIPARGISIQDSLPDLPVLANEEQWQWELPCN